MKGRRIFERVDLNLAPPWRDPPEPAVEEEGCGCMPWRCCAVCMTAEDGRLDQMSEKEN